MKRNYYIKSKSKKITYDKHQIKINIDKIPKIEEQFLRPLDAVLNRSSYTLMAIMEKCMINRNNSSNKLVFVADVSGSMG